MKKVLIITSVSLICLLGLFLLFLPSILSSEGGKNFLTRTIAQKTGGELSIQDLSLSWTKAQKIEDLRFEKQGEMLLTFDSLTLDTSFWNLLFRSGSLGETTLTKPQLTLSAKTFAPSTPSEKPPPILKTKKVGKPLWKNVSGKIKIKEGSLALRQANADLIRMDQIDFLLNLSKGTFPLTLEAEGSSQQKNLLGKFHAKAFVSQKEEMIDLETAEALEIDGEANLSNFPVAGIDALLSLAYPSTKGLLLATFGNNLNLDLSLEKVPQGENISLELRSPRMSTSFRAQYAKGMIRLKAPMNLTWTINPLVMQHLAPALPLILVGDSRSELSLDHLSLPFKNMQFDIHSLSTQGSLSMQRGAFSLATTKDSLLLDDLSLSFNTTRLKQLVNLSFKSIFRFSSFPQTSAQGSGVLVNAFDKKDFKQFDLNLRNFPTTLLDQKGALRKWIGSNFDLSATRSESDLTVNGSSPNLKLSSSRFRLDEGLTLATPTSFSYLLKPSHWSSLTHPITVTGSLENLKLPEFNWRKSELKANIKSQDIQLNNFLALGNLQLPFFQLSLEGSPLSFLSFQGSSSLDFAPNTWGRSLMGDNVKLQTSGKAQYNNELKISPLRLELASYKLKTTIDGALESGAFILKNPLEADFTLEPEQINPILVKGDEFPILAEKTPFKLLIKPGSFPLKKEAFSQVDLEANGSIASLKMISSKSGFPFSFENAQIDYHLSGKNKRSQLEFETQAIEKEEERGSIDLLIQSEKGHLNPLEAPSRVRVRFNKLSTQIADALFQMHTALPPMIGSWIDFNYDMEEKARGQDIAINVKSAYLTMDGSFTAYDRFELKSNRNPLKIEWNVSEEGIQAYKKWRNPNKPVKNPTFSIKDRSLIKLSVSPLTFPLKEKEGLFPKVDFNLYQGIFDVDIRINLLAFQQDRTKEVAELKRFDFNLHKDKTPGPLLFEIDGNVTAENASKSGHIKGKGTLEDYATPQGDLDLEDVTASIHAEIKQFPSVFLDALSNIKDPSGIPPSAFLGDLVNASFDVELIKENGKLDFDVDATNCRANLSGTVANGILHLNHPLRAAMTISPKMNEILASGAKVVVSSMKHPITLVVSEKGFTVPIKDLSLRSANVSYGVIDFGQIVCRNTGSASDVSGIFKMEGNQNLISLWFAPMEFNIHNGLMYVDRTEILFNRAYQVALWGDINFRRRFVDMTLGLTAQSLRAALGIRDLSPEYVLQVPVNGPFGNVRIDKGAATSKIALLIARKQVAPQAGVWGQVFGAIGGLADDQSGVPPPKPPFPWQQVLNMQEKTTTDWELEALFNKKAKEFSRPE